MDLDQELDRVLAASAIRTEDAVVAPAAELVKTDQSTNVDAVQAEKRRQILIESYTHWSRNRERHRRRDQRELGGETILSGHLSTRGTAEAALVGRTAADTGKRKEPESTAGALAIASSESRGRWIVRRGVQTTSVRWPQDGRNRCTLGPGGASRQLLISRDLRRARLLMRAKGKLDLLYGASLVREATLCRDRFFVLSNRLSSHRSCAVHVPPAESEPSSSPADVSTERALAVVTAATAGHAQSTAVLPVRAPGVGIDVGARAGPVSGIQQTPSLQIVGVANPSRSFAPPARRAAVFPPERRAGREQEVEHRGTGLSLVDVRRTRTTGGSRRHSTEPTKIPDAEDSFDGSSGNAGTNWGESDLGSSCRDIVILAQPTAPRIGVADEAVRGSAPATLLQSFGVSRRRQSGAVSHGAPRGSAEQPHRENTVEGVKQEEGQLLPRGRDGPSGDEANDVAAGVLVEAGKSAVNTLAPPPIHTTAFDQQIVPYLGNGGAAVWRTERATVQTVDIVCPAEAHSLLSQDGATPPRPQLDPKCHRSGGGGGSSSDGPSVRYAMKGQANDDDVSRASSPGACTPKRLADRSVPSVLRQWRPPPRAPSVKGATVRGGSGRIDGKGPDGENRVVPFCFERSVVKNVASEIAEGVPAVGGNPALWGKGDALRPEKSSEGDGSAQADTCQQQQVLGLTGSAPAGTRLCRRRSACVGQESTGTCPNAAKVLQATKPSKGAILPEKQESQGEGVVSAEPRATRESSPQTAAACSQDVVCVDDRPDGNVLACSVGKSSSKRSGSEGRRDTDGPTTLPRTVSSEYLGHHASDRQPEDGTLVPLEGHGKDVGEPRVPVWRGTAAGPPAEESRARSALQELPRRPLDALTATASSSDSAGPSTSPLFPSLLLPMPCTPSLPQVEATGEGVVHGNGRENGEVGPAEPMVPVMPLGGAILEGSTTRDAPVCSLAASSAAEFSTQPAASEALPLSPPALRSKQPIVTTSGVDVELGSSVGLDSSLELFSPPTVGKEASSPLPPPLVHCRRSYWSTGEDAASQAGTHRKDAEDSCTT